ncbi:MAG: hypothetical protein IT306_24185 [Chloroflexi bacterium]|nr:hypothetical protein [Chloroflexota bacterium]
MWTRLGSAAAALVLFVWIVGTPVGTAAVAGQPGGWEQVEPSPAVRLFAPTSGALLARTVSGLLRSDDGGMTWRAVSLPPQTQRPSAIERANAIVDPTNHDVMFAAMAMSATEPEELFRTTDGGQTWTKLNRPDQSSYELRAVTVSPADPRVVYASRRYFGDYVLLLSLDGGDTWEVRQRQIAGPSCGWGVPLFYAHPTDSAQAYRRALCARTTLEAEYGGVRVEHSADQGLTWTRLSLQGAASRIAGGFAVAPTRMYASSHLLDARPPEHNPYTDASYTTAVVLRSDNGLDGWTEVLRAPQTRIDALAVDPANADRVFVGRKDGLVMTTQDGGASWSELGRDIGAVGDLALGIDGRNLYAATATGIWRLALAE